MKQHNGKVVIVGIDSLTPRFVKKFTNNGAMVNLKALIDQGFSTELFPVVPPLTGPGWATIATGCWPSTHGVEGHFNHPPGEHLDKRVNAYSSNICKVKTIWERAEEQGKKTLVIKYPVSWPPKNVRERIQICGGGGFAEQDCPLQICHSRCFTTDKSIKDSFAWVYTPVQHINFRMSTEGNRKTYTSEIVVHPRGIGEMDCLPKKYLLKIKEEEHSLILKIYNTDQQEICRLKEGQWSNWILEHFIRTDNKKVEGYFKFKLIKCKRKNGKIRFKLYMTQIHDSKNYTVPTDLAEKLNQNVGPFIEHTDIHDYYARWIDAETLLQIWEEHTQYMKKLFSYLTSTYNFDLIFLQYHPIDYVLHGFLGGIDERHPDYKEEKSDYHWNIVEKTHKFCDDLIGSIIDCCSDNDTIFIVGDHGHALWKTTFFINRFLYQNGYLSLEFNNEGKAKIKWEKTRAFATGVDTGACQIYFNLKERDPKGIIEKNSKEYFKLQEDIINALYNLKAPDSGSTPVKLVMRKEELNCFGLKGDSIGELIVFQKIGYENQATLPTVNQKEPLFEKRSLGDFHTSEHGTFFPFENDLRTFLVTKGPHIVKGYSSTIAYPLIDVAPTIAFAAGINLPGEVEGRVIDKIFT